MAPPITCECGVCDKCKRRVRMRDYYRRNPEHVKATVKRSRARRLQAVIEADRRRHRATKRERPWDERNPEKAAAAHRAWRDRNPEKVRAQRILNYHVRAGNITREPCEVCREPNTHAHHDDYTKPLEVRWLCGPHHRQHHWKADAA